MFIKVNISARSSKNQTPANKSMGNGKQTMRMKSGKVEEKDDVVDLAINKINNLLESFMGIHDSELGMKKKKIILIFKITSFIII